MTKEDRMLQLVLNDVDLSSYYEYTPDDFTTIQEAFNTENPVVQVVAKIVPPLNDIDETKQFLILFKEQKFNRCTFMHSIFMEKIKTNITCNMRMQITLNEFKILK